MNKPFVFDIDLKEKNREYNLILICGMGNGSGMPAHGFSTLVFDTQSTKAAEITITNETNESLCTLDHNMIIKLIPALEYYPQNMTGDIGTTDFQLLDATLQ